MSRYTASSDWEKLADDFSAWLPLLAPYGERLIELARVADGDRVLDLACGTGEPGLTLARARPGARVIGADGARGMARAADLSRRTENLPNIRHAVMSGECLAFPDAAFDRVLCRFGMMLFDDPEAGVAELFRVLKPGGRAALSVWSVPERVQCPALTLHVLERFTHVEWPRTFSLSEPGRLAALCRKTGFKVVHEEAFDPGFTFDNVPHFMERNLTGRFIEVPLGRLSDARRIAFENALAAEARTFRQPDGSVRLPQEALLLALERP